MSDHTPTWTREGKGHVCQCSCGWLMFHRARQVLEGAHRKHLPKPREV